MRSSYVLLMGLLAVVCSSASTLAEKDSMDGKLVSEVKIEGNANVSDDEVVAIMKTQPDTAFDNIVFAKDIEALYETSSFLSVRPTFYQEEGAVQIKIVLSEKQIVHGLKFHGNKAIGDKKLMKCSGVQLGDTIHPKNLLAAKDRLKNLYKSEGYDQVSVELGATENWIVTFVIKEGKRDLLLEFK